VRFIDKLLGNENTASVKTSVSLDPEERAAIKRLLQHFDDGLIGQGPVQKDWEKNLDATARRLGFRDPFGQESVELKPHEVEALKGLHKVYEAQTWRVHCGGEMMGDIETLDEVLKRDGKTRDMKSNVRLVGHDIEF
jgi:hypothetical protein